jgi:transposase InsO family protein
LSIDNKTDVEIMTEDELIEFYIKENKRVDTSAPEAEESQIVEEEDETEAAVKIFLSLHSPYLQRPKPPPPSSSSTSLSSSSASMLSSPLMSLAAVVSWMTDSVAAACHQLATWAANTMVSSEGPIIDPSQKPSKRRKRKINRFLQPIVRLQRPTKYHIVERHRHIRDNHTSKLLKDGSTLAFIGFNSKRSATSVRCQNGRYVCDSTPHRTFVKHEEWHQGQNNELLDNFKVALAKTYKELNMEEASAMLQTWFEGEDGDLQLEVGSTYKTTSGEWMKVSSSTVAQNNSKWERDINGNWIKTPTGSCPTTFPPIGSCINVNGLWTCSPSSASKFQETEPFSTIPTVDAMNAGTQARPISSHEAIADTGANGHVFHNMVELFNRFRTNKVVHTAGGEAQRIDVSGDFEVKAVDKKGGEIEPLLLKNINQLPNCPINLISVSMLCKEGLSFHFEPDHAYFTYKGLNYPLEERNGLYVIDLHSILTPSDLDHYTKLMTPDMTHQFTASTQAHGCTYDLWHKRFGHANKRRIKFLYDHGSVTGLDVNGKFKHDKSCQCTTCLATNNAKIHIGEVRKHDDEITRRGQLIYSDVLGPFPPSVDGHRYAITYTDVYSRYSVVYLLKHKSEAPLTVKALHEYYEAHNIKISMIRTDQGGEYIGGHVSHNMNINNIHEAQLETEIFDEKFKAACDALKIEHELCPAYRPELHGICERLNRTLVKMANAMMHEARINTPLWGPAIAHANLLRNRLPVVGLGTLTPYEVFHGRRPRVDQLRVWGSFCWKLIPVRRKIPGQMIRKRLIYVGESPHRIGFKCFDPDTSKFTTEFELIFDEQGLSNRAQLLDSYDHRKPLAESEIIKQAGYELDDYNLAVARHIFTPPISSGEKILPEIGGATKQNKAGISASINDDEDSEAEEAIEDDEEEEEVVEDGDKTEEVQVKSAQANKWPRTSATSSKDKLQLPVSNPAPPVKKAKYKKVTFNEPDEPDEYESKDMVGPLTNSELEKALEESNFNFDQPEPKLPRRRSNRGVDNADASDEGKLVRWIKIATSKNYPIEILQVNPKKKESGKRYEMYKKAKTLNEIYNILAHGKNRKEVKSIRAKTLKDIKWDIQRGFITFPQHEYGHPGSKFQEQESIAMYCLHASSQEYEEIETNRPQSFQALIDSLWNQDESSIEQNDGTFQNNMLALACMKELLMENLPEPKSFKRANDKQHPEYEQWKEAMEREINTLMQKKTWNLVPRSKTTKAPVKCKFIYKKKFNKDGSLQYKARLVGCGYSQIAGEDYSLDEVYAGVCSYSSMRFLMSLACQKNYILYQTDITGAYLESELKEKVYMEVPPTMYVNGQPPKDENGQELVCEVQKGLYGLVQSGHAWSECFKEFLLKDKTYNMEFTELTAEPNMFRKSYMVDGKEEEIIIGQYVDDCLIAASSQQVLTEFMDKLKSRFPVNEKSSGAISVNDPGLLLSMQVKYDKSKGVLQFNQERAIETLAKRMEVTTDYPRRLPIRSPCELPKLETAEVSQKEYLSVIGSCLHICQVSRPDCAYAVGVLSRHSATPGHVHMEAAKDLVRYLYQTKELCIQYVRSKEPGDINIHEGTSLSSKKIEERLIASTPVFQSNEVYQMCDSDYAGDKITRKSTSGWISFMNGGCISWASRLQKLCAQSSAEAEIYAVVDSVKEAIHLKTLCEECNIRNPETPMNIWEDNNACIQMGHGLRGNKSAKHYEVRLRFLTENVKSRTIEFSRISTQEQIADGLTKPLPRILFEKFRAKTLVAPSL